MSITTALIAWLSGRAASSFAGPVAQETTTLEATDPDDEVPPRGCGWFVSSFELRAGLAVIEHEVLDATIVTWNDAEVLWC